MNLFGQGLGVAAAAAFATWVGAAATRAEAQPQGDVPPAPTISDAWQRQQPTRERARELAEQQGVAASPEERREQLRVLNEIHRQLMPPGATPPAPHLAPPPVAARPDGG